MKPFQVWEGVYLIGGPQITSGDDCCVYLLDGKSELTLIDAGLGYSASSLWDNIVLLGLGPEMINYIIVTHGHIDHIGGLAYFCAKTRAKVVAHETELPAIEGRDLALTGATLYQVPYQPVKVDLILKKPVETLPVGKEKINCLHTPGHTPGGISPYVDLGGKRILFGQDIHGPFNPAWGSNLQVWRQSMQKLLNLKADILCEGHFGIYEPKEEVSNYINYYLQLYGQEK
ncbi:MAG TPA: Zn-dependent hydrolase [Desulfotomaculum sp.]|nr:Zn-dependent hydrolase [Desulfotomaculum sp.]